MKYLIRIAIIFTLGLNVYATLATLNEANLTSEFISFQDKSEFIDYVNGSLDDKLSVNGRIVTNTHGQIILFPIDQYSKLKSEELIRSNRVEVQKILEGIVERGQREFNVYISPTVDGNVRLNFSNSVFEKTTVDPLP